jgi:hypothetical protein
MRLAPHVTVDMLDAAFWLERALDPDAPLLAPEQITAFNARVHDVLGIPPVLSLPDTLPCDEVVAQMRAYIPNRVLYDMKGQPVEPASFEKMPAQVMDILSDPVRVHFGLATQCANVRAFPTAAIYTSKPFDYAFDRFQETTVDVGWPVAIVGTSHNEDLFFCLTPLYWGWIHRAYVVSLGDREILASYTTAEPFIMTTASWGGLVNVLTGQAFTSQMGTRLPLAGETGEVYETRLPAPHFAPGYTRKDDFAVGYLPLTVRSLFTQAFRLLGEPYAWGGSRFGVFGRDCSRMVQDVYATTGVRLPRNSDQQGRACYPTAIFTPDMDDETRRVTLVEKVSPGALLELPGHIVMYLGHVEGKPYVIHDTSSSGFSEVIVSDLSLGADSPSGSLLRRMTQAVELISG